MEAFMWFWIAVVEAVVIAVESLCLLMYYIGEHGGL
jgi:hypothetical protein